MTVEFTAGQWLALQMWGGLALGAALLGFLCEAAGEWKRREADIRAKRGHRP